MYPIRAIILENILNVITADRLNAFHEQNACISSAKCLQFVREMHVFYPRNACILD